MIWSRFGVGVFLFGVNSKCPPNSYLEFQRKYLEKSIFCFGGAFGVNMTSRGTLQLEQQTKTWTIHSSIHSSGWQTNFIRTATGASERPKKHHLYSMNRFALISIVLLKMHEELRLEWSSRHNQLIMQGLESIQCISQGHPCINMKSWP